MNFHQVIFLKKNKNLFQEVMLRSALFPKHELQRITLKKNCLFVLNVMNNNYLNNIIDKFLNKSFNLVVVVFL